MSYTRRDILSKIPVFFLAAMFVGTQTEIADAIEIVTRDEKFKPASESDINGTVFTWTWDYDDTQFACRKLARIRDSHDFFLIAYPKGRENISVTNPPFYMQIIVPIQEVINSGWSNKDIMDHVKSWVPDFEAHYKRAITQGDYSIG